MVHLHSCKQSTKRNCIIIIIIIIIIIVVVVVVVVVIIIIIIIIIIKMLEFNSKCNMKPSTEGGNGVSF